MASCLVYQGKLPGKVYIGCAKLDLQERLRTMKAKPVHWLKGHDKLRNLKLSALCLRRVPEAKALALEAAYTASHWQKNPQEVRGGPYCLARLPSALTSELKLLSTSLEGKTLLKEQVDAVEGVAALLPRSGALNRHLRGQCFKCGGKFTRCSCRVPRVGFHAQEKPPKRRSGKSASGCQKRKQTGWSAADPRAVQHKWGGDVKAMQHKWGGNCYSAVFMMCLTFLMFLNFLNCMKVMEFLNI